MLIQISFLALSRLFHRHNIKFMAEPIQTAEKFHDTNETIRLTDFPREFAKNVVYYSLRLQAITHIREGSNWKTLIEGYLHDHQTSSGHGDSIVKSTGDTIVG